MARGVRLIRFLALVAVCMVAVVTACGSPEPVATPTPTPTPTPVPFETFTFKVGAGTSSGLEVHALRGTRIEVQVTSDNDINLELRAPDGSQIQQWHRVISTPTIRHVATAAGTHRVVFDNSFSMFTSKTVTVRYRAVPPGRN